jgi:ubiquinone/menaquinone biosynthesis C-methylase UbiE
MERFEVEAQVQARYGHAAARTEPALCCPVDYDTNLLAAIPDEILAVDYGCGDPSRHARAGETVLDLGSGSGKSCFIVAQVVGPSGRVIGVDLNAEMLALARRHQPTVATRLGYDNVAFRRGRIQDLATDVDALDARVRAHPIASLDDLHAFEHWQEAQRHARPLIADASVDLVMSNCVLNLVADEQKDLLFGEIARVLRRGGRAVISDIVSDEPVPARLKADAELWSGCISGAFQEAAFLDAFARAGFYGMEILARGATPWRTVEGIEFRSVTVAAFIGKDGPCWERNQAVIYQGPWHTVTDDDGHTLRRGVPTAVCEKTYEIYTRAPYGAAIVPVPPRVEIRPDEAQPFDCGRASERRPAETKGSGYRATTDTGPACCPST